MSAKRKLKDGSIPQAKHKYSLRSKSKCNRFELENLCLRFPVLCDKILNQLNPQSLATCKGLSSFWYDQIMESRTYWVRKIQIYTEDFNQYKEDWATFETKTPLKTLKELATALYVFRDLGKEEWKIHKIFLKMLNLESDDQWSPLHIAAKFSLELFKEIALKFNKINRANNNGETPLHSAAKSGHLDILKFILKNIQEDKNPKDNVGFTPLHYAAICSNLEIFKFIVQIDENANPVKGSGILPYHCALYLEDEEICKFIEEKYNCKKKSNEIFFSNSAKICIGISRQKALGQNRMPLTNHKLALCKKAFALSKEREKILETRLAENKRSLAENDKLLVNAK